MTPKIYVVPDLSECDSAVKSEYILLLFLVENLYGMSWVLSAVAICVLESDCILFVLQIKKG